MRSATTSGWRRQSKRKNRSERLRALPCHLGTPTPQPQPASTLPSTLLSAHGPDLRRARLAAKTKSKTWAARRGAGGSRLQRRRKEAVQHDLAASEPPPPTRTTPETLQTHSKPRILGAHTPQPEVSPTLLRREHSKAQACDDGGPGTGKRGPGLPARARLRPTLQLQPLTPTTHLPALMQSSSRPALSSPREQTSYVCAGSCSLPTMSPLCLEGRGAGPSNMSKKSRKLKQATQNHAVHVKRPLAILRVCDPYI